MVQESPLPNIVILIADEMRGDVVSLGKKCNSIIKTPNIDQLAKDGVAFRNCFTVNPVCAPSRCCTFTGQYVHSNAHRSLYYLLQPFEENLFKLLKEKGYEVIWIGRNDLFSKKAISQSISKRIPMKIRSIKTNPFPKDHRLRKSFYFGETNPEQAKDIDQYTIKNAIEYLEKKPSNPFCLYLAFSLPHPPYTVEEPYFSMYDRNEVPPPIPPKLDDKPEFMRIIHERYDLDKLSKEDFKEIIATYYGMISKLDFNLGQIIQKLKDIGEYDKTAIVFLSDHGDFMGDYGLTEKWPNSFQDCLIKVPLVMKIPGIESNDKVYEQLVETIDIFPTILDIAQIKTKYTHFGKSLIPLLKGEVKTHRKMVFSEGGYDLREPQCFEDVIKNPDVPVAGIYYDKTNIPQEKPSTVSRSVMIRTKLWKLILRDNDKEELYDLMYDPNEINNLIDISAYDKIKADLKDKLVRWYLKTSDNTDWRRGRYILD